ncbi:terpene synthase [Ganoderma sinense ZZ0214-1]|uniref:Terpene synthase n=1 Tax=Ganoderma sinense ZZ0214-1 TaxID=1077348 RepID=A0A2G8RLL9_9APHY|nr:terpene synthase [Ganoderma sinense ZZ0214-1]
MPQTIRLPETMANWPLPRRLNPHYAAVVEQSAEWISSFGAFGPKAQLAFDKCNIGLLATMSYPTLSKEHYRIGCDLMNLFFVWDDHTDPLSAAEVRAIADCSLDAIHNPDKERPEGESVIGEITRQFWVNALASSTSETFQRRFKYKWEEFLRAVIEQAEDRDSDRCRTVEEYLSVRRLTIGAEPSYAVAEASMDLPQEVFDNPLLVALRRDVTDLIILDNDMSSYNKEQAVGDDHHNIITIVMRQKGYNLQEALGWLAAEHKVREDRILTTSWPQVAALKFSPDVDELLKYYVDHVLNWPRANDSWNFESGRYFGSEGLRIQKERVVKLLPKRQPARVDM